MHAEAARKTRARFRCTRSLSLRTRTLPENSGARRAARGRCHESPNPGRLHTNPGGLHAVAGGLNAVTCKTHAVADGVNAVAGGVNAVAGTRARERRKAYRADEPYLSDPLLRSG
jgi:hypothetical protein